MKTDQHRQLKLACTSPYGMQVIKCQKKLECALSINPPHFSLDYINKEL